MTPEEWQEQLPNLYQDLVDENGACSCHRLLPCWSCPCSISCWPGKHHTAGLDSVKPLV